MPFDEVGALVGRLAMREVPDAVNQRASVATGEKPFLACRPLRWILDHPSERTLDPPKS
jgi:hypothetical protein